jgi:hypothetical protein
MCYYVRRVICTVVVVKCVHSFEVKTEFLNIIYMSFAISVLTEEQDEHGTLGIMKLNSDGSSD